MNPDPNRSDLLNAGAVPGVCRYCRCTDDRPCVDRDRWPCDWVEGTGKTVCTACQGLNDAAGLGDGPRVGLDARIPTALLVVVLLAVVVALGAIGWAILEALQ